jgi:hypothetical protein
MVNTAPALFIAGVCYGGKFLSLDTPAIKITGVAVLLRCYELRNQVRRDANRAASVLSNTAD